MITIQKNQKPIVRETTADFEYEENGVVKTEKIRVRYYDWTTKQLKEQQAAFKAKLGEDDPLWHTDTLAHRLQSLPDLIDAETGEPVEVTLAFLDGLSVKNVGSIRKAVEDDLNPKPIGVSSPEK